MGIYGKVAVAIVTIRSRKVADSVGGLSIVLYVWIWLNEALWGAWPR